MTGTNGMYSSAIPTVEAPSAKRPTAPPISQAGRDPSRAIAAPIAASIAPVALTTPMTPPTRKTKKMTSCAAPRPAGIDVRKASGGERLGLHRVVRPWHHTRAVPLELSRRQDAARPLRQQDQRDDQDERIGKPDPLFSPRVYFRHA